MFRYILRGVFGVLFSKRGRCGKKKDEGKPLTFDILEDIAYGNLGLSEKEFYYSTPKWFFKRLRGYSKSKEEEEITKWRMVRWQTAALLNISMKELKHRISPEDLIELPGDKPTFDLTIDEIEFAKKILQNHNKTIELAKHHAN